MKIESLKPGMTVYDVGRRKMGNTTITTVSVCPVHVVSVDAERGAVIAQLNGSRERVYFKRDWSKWRAHRPVLVTSITGRQRLETRAERSARIAKDRTP